MRATLLFTAACSLLSLTGLATAAPTDNYDVSLQERQTAPVLWYPKGCYSDNMSARTLGQQVYSGPNNTIDNCRARCLARNFRYAGVEYGSECYCGLTIRSTAVRVVNQTACEAMNCSGDKSGNTKCGNGNRIKIFDSVAPPPVPTTTSVVKPTPTAAVNNTLADRSGSEYWGCYSDNSTSRTLPYNAGTTVYNTIELCISKCNAKGYIFSGLVGGTDCRCGNALNGVEVPGAQCNVRCPNNATEYCGGTAPLSSQVYAKISSNTTSYSRNGYVYQGCYSDSQDYRSLSYNAGTTSANTVNLCISKCSAQGYAFAGVEYGSECGST